MRQRQQRKVRLLRYFLYYCFTHINAAAGGMSRTNNDFGRSAEFLVGREKESIGKTLGTFHNIPPELRKSLIQCARENAKKMKKWYDDALERQRAARQRKEEIVMEHKLDKAKEDYINAIYFYKQYHSKRCWLTVEQARLEWREIKTKTDKLRAVKEQIHIRLFGLGWKEAHHPWSKEGYTYTPEELFDHLVNVVIPLASKLDVPSEASTELPAPPDLPVLGTKAEIDLTKGSCCAGRIQEPKLKAHEERDARELEGLGDRWSEQQQFTAPKINSSLVG